jgi:hypothetical protein
VEVPMLSPDLWALLSTASIVVMLGVSALF